jgi:hypothetical protein
MINKNKENKDSKKCCDIEVYAEEIEVIKKEYEKLSKKYDLPDFDKLNEEFDICRCDINIKTPIRDVRKAMALKFSSLLSFVELLLNPSNGSMFYMFLVRGIEIKEKETLEKLFSELGKMSIDSFALDIEYSEQKEAQYIKENFKQWQVLKKDALSIADALKKGWGKAVGKKDKSYFG